MFFFQQRAERKKQAIYIIDVYFIGNENLIVENEKPTVFIDRSVDPSPVRFSFFRISFFLIIHLEIDG